MAVTLDEVALRSEDEKRIRATGQRALKKKKMSRVAKSGQKLSIFSLFFSALPVLYHYCTYSSFKINSLFLYHIGVLLVIV